MLRGVVSLRKAIDDRSGREGRELLEVYGLDCLLLAVFLSVVPSLHANSTTEF